MSYLSDFQDIIKILSNGKNICNTNMIIFKNNQPDTLKIFPEETSSSVIDHYLCYLSTVIKDNDFVDFIPNKKEPGTLQVISTKYLMRWNEILISWNNKSDVNVKEILVDDYTCDGNTTLFDVELVCGDHIYFVARYKKVSSWYSNNIRFTKRNGKFHEEKGEILALTPFVDAVIYKEFCYVINETNFSVIFNFDEVVRNQIKENENKIRTMNFINDPNSFMSFLYKSKRQRNAMAKVIMQDRLDKIKKYTPEYIRSQIEGQKELSFIKYTEDNKIIMDDKKSFETVVRILCGTINLDIITMELNGLDGYE